MTKQSLTFILTVLISVISGCTTTSSANNKNFIDINDISKVLNTNKLTLNYSLSNENKEYFISALLNKEYEYDVSFKTEYGVLIEELNVMGSADIVLLDSEGTASVLDIKTTHSYKWKMMFGRNREKSPSRMYELQLGTYALGVCNQENVNPDSISLYLVYYKKDDSSMKYVDVNPVWMDNAAEYWVTLNETLSLVKEEADLPRDTLNVPIENWECRYCQFESICN